MLLSLLNGSSCGGVGKKQDCTPTNDPVTTAWAGHYKAITSLSRYWKLLYRDIKLMVFFLDVKGFITVKRLIFSTNQTALLVFILVISLSQCIYIINDH